MYVCTRNTHQTVTVVYLCRKRERMWVAKNGFSFYSNMLRNFGFSLKFKGECLPVSMLYEDLIFKKLLCRQNTSSSIVFPEYGLLLFYLILSTVPSVIILVSHWALRSLFSLPLKYITVQLRFPALSFQSS